jgi:hypothetical protein
MKADTQAGMTMNDHGDVRQRSKCFMRNNNDVQGRGEMPDRVCGPAGNDR